MLKFIILLAVFFSPHLNAQDDVLLQFVSFPKATEPEPLELYIGEEEDLIKVDIPTNRLSSFYKVPRMAKWTLGRTVFNENNDPKFKVLGEVASIIAKRQLIIIIRNGRDNNNGLKLINISNNANNIGGGDFFFMNLTSYEIAGKLSNKKLSVKPRKFTIIKPKPSHVKGIYKYCDVKLFYRDSTETKSFYSSTWRLNDRSKNFTFFYEDILTKRIKTHTIENYLPAGKLGGFNPEAQR